MTRVIFERDVPCELRDGTVLMTDIYRPDDGEPHPVVLQRTPYDKRGTTGSVIDPTRVAEAGYVVALQDVRGRFASQGVFVPYRTEGPDGHDAVQWAAAQPWSDGNVAMCGISYLAQVQLQAAAERPAALRAITPIESPSGSTGGDRHRGGALALGVLSSWNSAMALGEFLRAVRTGSRKFEEFPALVDDLDNLETEVRRLPLLPFPLLERRAPHLSESFAQTVRGEFNPPLPRFDHADIAVPALLVAGWHDLFIQADLDHYVAFKQRAGSEDARRLTRLVVGPWSHGAPMATVGQIEFGFRASPLMLDLREDLTELHRRWFDARLRGLASGIDEEPPVRLFVMGRNRWRDEDEWPLPRARVERWYLNREAAGLAPAPPQLAADPSVFRLDPDDPVPTHGGTLLMTGRYIKGPLDQAPTEARDDVLLFTSESVAAPLEVTGRVKLVAWVAAETQDTDVVARLCDVHPDGRSFNVVDGILRLYYRGGIDNPRPLTPGEVVQVEIDLWSTSHVFMPGHRLRLQVCASDFPRYDRCPGTGQNSADATEILPQRNLLFHDPEHPSHLELPVVPPPA